MTVRAYYRDELALTQLETALHIYFDGNDFASVITLAGAADEIFGKLFASSGRDNSLEVLKKAVAEIHQNMYGEPFRLSEIAERANRAKNSLKHWVEGQLRLSKSILSKKQRTCCFAR